MPITMLGLYKLAVEKGFFNIQKITITLQSTELNPQYINEVLPELEHEIQKFKHQNIWKIDRSSVHGLFVDRAFIADYLVVKHWPSHLEVTVKISKAVLWMESTKGIRPLFENKRWGQYINDSSLEVSPKLFIEHGEAEKNRLKIFDVAQVIINNKKIDLQNIEKIKFTKAANIQLTLKSKQTDILLNEMDLIPQLERVTQVLDYLERYQIEARVIDSQYTKKVLVRLHTRP